jgi:hypothetical protein
MAHFTWNANGLRVKKGIDEDFQRDRLKMRVTAHPFWDFEISNDFCFGFRDSDFEF